MTDWKPFPKPSDVSHAAMQTEHADNLGAQVALAVTMLARMNSEGE